MARSSGEHDTPLDSTSTMMLGAIDELDAEGNADSETARYAASLPPNAALLIVRRGPNAGSRFLLDAVAPTRVAASCWTPSSPMPAGIPTATSFSTM